MKRLGIKSFVLILVLFLAACTKQNVPVTNYAQEITLELFGTLESSQARLPVQGIIMLSSVQHRLVLSLLPAPSLGQCDFIPDLQCIPTNPKLEQPLYMLGKAVQELLSAWDRNKGQNTGEKLEFSLEQITFKDMAFPKHMRYNDDQFVVNFTVTGIL